MFLVWRKLAYVTSRSSPHSTPPGLVMRAPRHYKHSTPPGLKNSKRQRLRQRAATQQLSQVCQNPNLGRSADSRDTEAGFGGTATILVPASERPFSDGFANISRGFGSKILRLFQW
jgi:hypothetical protein